MVNEMHTLDGNGTWDLVPLPARKKAIGCCWVFVVKFNLDGVDYSDTFSPVAKLTFVHLFISLAASYDWDLLQLDIMNAFVHGDLQEEVYVKFVAQGEIGQVCRLWIYLYGLKQSPCGWFDKFSQTVETFGMQKSKSDHFVFYKNPVMVLFYW